MQTKELLALLQRHYIKPSDPLPGGIFVSECGINGSGRQSRADALYVGFTSTSGRLLVGHEIKVSRSDWLRELDKVGKADFWADACHQWWIVAPGPEVAPKEEIPHGWGLMYPGRSKTRMQIVVRAETHADRVPPWNAVRSIMSRIDSLRASHDQQVRQAAADQARKDLAEWREREAQTSRRLTPEQQEKVAALDDLEHILGAAIRTYVWSGDTSGEAKVDTRTAAAALRLVIEAQKIGLDRVPTYSMEALADAADRLLKGLQEFTDAREALLAITGGGRR